MPYRHAYVRVDFVDAKSIYTHLIKQFGHEPDLPHRVAIYLSSLTPSPIVSDVLASTRHFLPQKQNDPLTSYFFFFPSHTPDFFL